MPANSRNSPAIILQYHIGNWNWNIIRSTELLGLFWTLYTVLYFEYKKNHNG
jgi:hypothetical protein